MSALGADRDSDTDSVRPGERHRRYANAIASFVFKAGGSAATHGRSPRGGRVAGSLAFPDHASSVMHCRVTTNLSSVSERRLRSLLARGASSPTPDQQTVCRYGGCLTHKVVPWIGGQVGIFSSHRGRRSWHVLLYRA